ncbi:type II toxin-antitoxin system HipA family toxin [Arsenicicoccus dermatophilus]|uniref:type II toxin-antitoxin system HipA family toxin n=1 Tax=Arsenicicoccus dermatophilus TaxID=1076331 RepID=UPI003916D16C
MSVEVWLSAARDTRVGTLHAHAGRGAQSFSFAYADDYLARPDAYPIDPALPLRAGAFHSHGRLFGALADSAPDRWGRTLVRRTLAEAARASGETPRQPGELDLLLGVRDDLRQGALRYRLADDGFEAAAEEGVPVLTELGVLLSLADRVLADEADLSDLRRLVGAGSSLGGARPKAHVRLPGGAVGIAKFPAALHDDWNVMAWEKVTLDLAAAAGITVPPSRLIPVAGQDVLVVERFDRRGDRRVGYVSAMTMLEAADGDRATWLDLAEVVEEVSPRPVQDLRELWRRCAFGILVGNTDNHLRNHGFLRERTGWALAPAFDLNPTPFAAEFATDVADLGDGGSTQAALDVAGYFRLGRDEAETVLGEVRDAVLGWDRAAAAYGIGERERARMAPAFARAD